MNESIRAQIASLGAGECVSRSQRVKMSAMGGMTALEIMDKMRLSIQPAVTRATRETGMSYRVEGGYWITRSGDLVLNVIVTVKEDLNG